MLLRCAQQNYLAGIPGADEHSAHPFCALNGSEAQALLRLQVGNVGVAAVVMNAEDASAIPAQRQQAIGTGSQRIDNLILARPEFAWRLALCQSVNICPLGHRDTGVCRLQRLRLHNRDTDRADSLHRQRRQWVAALVAHARRIDRAVRPDHNGRNLTPWCLEEHVSVALRIDAVDQP